MERFPAFSSARVRKQRLDCGPRVSVKGYGVGLIPRELGVVYVDIH